MDRIVRLQQKLSEGESVLITGEANRLYYTGFKSSAGILFVTKTSADFIIDFRYFEKAERLIKSCRTILMTKASLQLQELVKTHGIKLVYIETSYMTVSDKKHYAEVFFECNLSEDSTINDFILAERSIKSSVEIDFIRQAQSITDDTFSWILNKIEPRKTEMEIALEMEFYLRRQGSEGVSFDFIVVSGKNSSLPHGVPTNKMIEKGDFITMDFGAVVNGYRSDMTRTVAVGNCSDYQKKVYHTVLDAQKLSINEIRAGKVCKEIDRIARNYINKNGFEGRFGHGLGHSVGIEIHESPCFNTIDSKVLESGMIITVEPGIYLPNQFGVRIEDMVLVTDEGCENLTKSPKELIIL